MAPDGTTLQIWTLPSLSTIVTVSLAIAGIENNNIKRSFFNLLKI
jgi:hypothetical protein